jgi:uroporphyrinogen III methyltransferase/synthase
MTQTGTVYLVGAGPGDPGLITLKGVECLKKADVVIYDALSDERLVAHAPEAAERIYVGKKAGQHTLPQDDINRLLASKAKQGKTVVRLKGGDPFVFGRGGEEADVLKREGVPYEVVSGITSAVAVPAYAGIPVTHRGVASSFAVITGHEDPAKAVSALDWEHLGKGIDTLVFLMGMQNIAAICENLVKNGRPADTPAAVIREGTGPTQQTVTGTLENIAGRAREAKLGAPAVIVVGDVVGLRDRLQWFDNRPLFGKRVLVTRARRQASALSKLLAERGAEAVELPTIAITPAADGAVSRTVADLGQYDWVLFTSVNGVTAIFDELARQGGDTRAFGGLHVGAIGPATAATLAELGINADLVPDTFTTEGVIAALRELDIAGRRFLLPRADIADARLAEAIRRHGGAVTEVAAYHTTPDAERVAEAGRLLEDGKIDVVTFTSSSTVTNLVKALDGRVDVLDGIVVASIGPRTTETALARGLHVTVTAGEATIPGLVQALETHFREGGS